MKSTIVCIVCPVSCPVEVEWTKEDGVLGLKNHLCRLAGPYVESELFDPRRLLTTSIPVDGGDWPLVSVKTEPPIPKDKMLEAMDEITGVRVNAPVKIGDILIENLLGTGSDVVATRNVDAA
ncbi:MAG: DUF1667 domain-containing protein [Candidatus Poribacteria bacterium]|nr:DUF1667 domain-containing protein [Candidatus Poribacteria bacterium]|tara:strand:- start:180 stop:545 length:366 start_codon:yes stop_codon:yes gene_type:complete